MSFWSGEKLKQNSYLIDDFSEDRQDCSAYNLRVGNTYYATSEEAVNKQKRIDLKDGEAFIIAPGQFAFLVTRETINVPENAIAFISMRTGIKFQGLINVSGFHVDPGYKGKLVYSVYNASPTNIQISEGDPLFKIWFADLDQTSGKDYIYTGAAPKTISNDLIRGMSREVLSLQGLSEKIREIEADVKVRFAAQQPTIDTLHFIYRGFIVSALVALVALIFSFAKPVAELYGDQIKNYLQANRQSVAPAANSASGAANSPSIGVRPGD